MLVVRTIENPSYPICEFVSSKKPIGLYNLALAVYPLGLYGVQPRTLFRQKAAYGSGGQKTQKYPRGPLERSGGLILAARSGGHRTPR